MNRRGFFTGLATLPIILASQVKEAGKSKEEPSREHFVGDVFIVSKTDGRKIEAQWIASALREAGNAH